MSNLTKQLTIKYAFLQSTYWISQCSIYSFAAVYLHFKHFDNTQIGFVLSLSSILSIILQPLVAAFADKSRKISLRSMVILLMLIVLLSSLILYVVSDSFLVIAAVFILVNTIQFTLIPLLNSLAFEYINKGYSINYGLARGTGSIAFAIASYFIGISVNHFGAGILIGTFVVSYLFLILSAYFFKSRTHVNTSGDRIDTKNGRKKAPIYVTTQDAPTGIMSFFMKYKKYSLFLLGVAMIYYSHSLLNTYLINIIENVGGNSADMGLALTIAATLELPTMAAFVFLIKKIDGNNLIKISAFFYFLKAMIAWLAPSVTILYLSQACQMFAFALFTPASVYYVDSIIDKRDTVKGQAMLGVASLGIAGTIANLTGGEILDTMGVSYVLFLGMITAAVGFIVICFTAEKTKKKT